MRGFKRKMLRRFPGRRIKKQRRRTGNGEPAPPEPVPPEPVPPEPVPPEPLGLPVAAPMRITGLVLHANDMDIRYHCCDRFVCVVAYKNGHSLTRAVPDRDFVPAVISTWEKKYEVVTITCRCNGECSVYRNHEMAVLSTRTGNGEPAPPEPLGLPVAAPIMTITSFFLRQNDMQIEYSCAHCHLSAIVTTFKNGHYFTRAIPDPDFIPEVISRWGADYKSVFITCRCNRECELLVDDSGLIKLCTPDEDI